MSYTRVSGIVMLVAAVYLTLATPASAGVITLPTLGSDGLAIDECANPIKSVVGKKHSRVRVTFEDDTKKTVRVFTRVFKKRTRVKALEDSCQLYALAPDGTRLSLVSATTGKIYKTVRLSAKPRWNTAFYLQNLYQDASLDAVVTSKRGDAIRLQLVSGNLDQKKLRLRDTYQLAAGEYTQRDTWIDEVEPTLTGGTYTTVHVTGRYASERATSGYGYFYIHYSINELYQVDGRAGTPIDPDKLVDL